MSNYSSFRRVLVHGFFHLTGLLVAACVVVAGLALSLSAQTTSGPRIYIADPYALVSSYVGTPSAVQALAAGSATPLAMTAGDLDKDGVQDLAVGYGTAQGGVIALYRGNLDAFAPQSAASHEAIGQSRFPDPYLPQVTAFSVPERPEFLAAGDFNGDGNVDLVFTSRTSTTLLVLYGDGKGNFSAPMAVSLPGSVTALTAGNLGPAQVAGTLLVGVTSAQGSSLLVYSGSNAGPELQATFPLDAPATNLIFAPFELAGNDAAFLSGGQVWVLRYPTMQLVKIPLPVSGVAMAAGSFLYDRSPALQIAVLSSDGTVSIAVHNEFDSTMRTAAEIQAIRAAVRGRNPSVVGPRMTFAPTGWKIVESVSLPVNNVQPPALFFRTRISDHAADDLALLNPLTRQLMVISHPNLAAGATTFLPGEVSVRGNFGAVVAALPLRTNVDGRPGLVVLNQGAVALSVVMPLPDPNFFVNRTDDPIPTSPITNACNNTSFTDMSSSCSLREAILKANGDTINLQANTTYTLTIGRGASQDYSGNTGALYVNKTVTIVGGAQPTTVIAWGTPTTGSKDMVMAVNGDYSFTTTATASLSNLTIQGGINNGTYGLDGDGGCMEFDTGTNGTASLTLTNVNIQNCQTAQGDGGGLAVFNLASGTGHVNIDNSYIRNNTVANSVTNEASGGGISVADQGRIVMTSSQVSLNHAPSGLGGGVYLAMTASGSPQSTITRTTINGNNASSGGGVWDSANLKIQDSTIAQNTATGVGGGLYLNPTAPDSTTISSSTITGNSTSGVGGGIATGNVSGAGPLTLSYSRLARNSAASAANLSNTNTAVTATNNWWGTNSPATTISDSNGGTTSYDPYIALPHVASPGRIRINQSTTLTGDMSKDNHASGTALSGNLDVIAGLPITFDSLVLGTIPQAQPELLNSSAQATATFNAGGGAGFGSAHVTVDQASVPVCTRVR